MTQMQINYHTLEEQKRSNAAREYETARSNRAQESENYRSNTARERENYRSNTAKEKETHRSNLASERNNARKSYADLIKAKAYDKNAVVNEKKYLLDEQLLPYTQWEKATKSASQGVDALTKVGGALEGASQMADALSLLMAG